MTAIGAAAGADVHQRPHIEVVPRRGLPFVAAALVFVVVAIATNSLWMLMFSHVVGGAMWTALDLFLGLILGPIMGHLSPPARTEFAARLMPKMVLIMPTVVAMNLAAGFQMALRLGFLRTGSPNHAWLIASMIVVGVMAVIALGILEPANIAVLVEMNKPTPAPEKIGALMKRFIATAGITGVMQIATLIIMTRVASR
ncbi:MAG: hypothetical protein ACP5OV_06430 [Acidimicrobiales bacterium]